MQVALYEMGTADEADDELEHQPIRLDTQQDEQELYEHIDEYQFEHVQSNDNEEDDDEQLEADSLQHLG